MDPKFHILYIQHATEISGSLMSLYYTIDGLKKSSFTDVTTSVLCQSRPIQQWYLERDIKAQYFPQIETVGHCSGHTYQLYKPIDLVRFISKLIKLPFSIYRQYQFFKKSSYHLIHLNSSTLLSSAIAARMAKKKVIWHIREVLADGLFGIRKKIWQKLILNYSDHVVCISEMEADHIAPMGHDKISIVYNFIPFEQFKITKSKEEFLSKYNLDPKNKYILSLGGTNPIKLTSVLIAALTKLPNDYHALIAGECTGYLKFKQSLITRLSSIIKILLGGTGQLEYWRIFKWEKKRDGQVHFLGPCQNIADLIGACDALYFGASIPHFPRPVYETWFLGRPVLALKHNETKQHVLDKQNGLLSTRANYAKLAENIEQLCTDSEFAKALAANGQKCAQEKFDLSKNITKLIDLYIVILFEFSSIEND